ncbi:MAG: NUDIX hydrolase [Nocardioides sp.]
MTDDFDYHGAILVVEVEHDEIVLVHPEGTTDAPASLPGGSCEPGEHPLDGAVRIARELTGLEVEITSKLPSFVQEGTPTGTMLAHGLVARPVGGSLLAQAPGPDGPVTVHRWDELPDFVSVRVAIHRVRDDYVARRRGVR